MATLTPVATHATTPLPLTPPAPVAEMSAADRLQNELFAVYGRNATWLPVADLVAYKDGGDGFNRSLIETHAAHIAKHFDPRGLGLLTVSQRADGTQWILDGQHRVEALRRLGILMAPCLVHYNLTRQREAELWQEFNGNRRAAKSLDLFHNAVQAEDASALEVRAVVQACGYDVARYFNSRNSSALQAVSALRWIHKKGGPAHLSDVLSTLHRVYPDNRRATAEATLYGFHMFFHVYGAEIDRERLVRVLLSTSFDDLTRQAAQFASMYGRGRKTPYAYALLNLYNRGKRGARLDPAKLERYSQVGKVGEGAEGATVVQTKVVTAPTLRH